MLNKDISPIFSGWDYDPDHVSARWITGNDGLPKVQLRLDLGLFQMEPEGRPDGTTPHGHPSFLDYYLDLEKNSVPEHPALRIGEGACAELQQEAVQYYYRYVSFSALRHFDGVIRDTEHNLRLFEFVARHATDEDLAWQFLQFYPYVRMMYARALAERASEKKNYDEALSAIDDAIKEIRNFWQQYEDEAEAEDCEEIAVLNELARTLKLKKPRTKADQLQEALRQAIETENYEQAASLRDALDSLGVPEPPT